MTNFMPSLILYSHRPSEEAESYLSFLTTQRQESVEKKRGKLLINALDSAFKKNTQDFDKEDKKVLQCCTALTMCIFAIYTDRRKKTDLIWSFLMIFTVAMFKTWVKLIYVNYYI